jgi:hypothetical protein
MLAQSNQAWHASRTANTAWQRLRRGGTRAVTGAWLTHPVPAIPAVVVTDPFPSAATAAPAGVPPAQTLPACPHSYRPARA